jgi:SAM-dependent methyltransferase
MKRILATSFLPFCVLVLCGCPRSNDTTEGLKTQRKPPRVIMEPHPADTAERDIQVLADMLRYCSSDENENLQKILDDNSARPSRYLGLVEFAGFVLDNRAPKSDLAKARFEFLRIVPGRLHQCLWQKIPAGQRDDPSMKEPVSDNMPSELYVEGIFKLIRCPSTPVDELRGEVAPLKVKPGETVADIGYGSGRYVFLLARQVGPSGKAVGVEISPFLVDYLNAAAGILELPQLSGVLGADKDIKVPAETLDAVFIRYVFSNLRDDPQAWLGSIFSAMKPGGRMLILQHYSPEDVERHKGMIDAFLAGGRFPVAKSIPCRLKSPEVVGKLCANVGFEVVSVQKDIAADHVYALQVRKPE